MVAKASTKKTARAVSDDIKDVAKELAMLDADPTADITEISKSVKTKAKTTAKKAASTAKKATASAKETAKKASVSAKKATASAKETAKKAGASAKKTVTKAVANAKKDVTRTAVVEHAGNQFEVSDVISRCEAKYKSETKKDFKDIKVYIKPENNAAYYVVDEKSAGMINLI